MSKKRKVYDDDDGRSIVDMSGVDRQTPFGFIRSSDPPRQKNEHKEEAPESGKSWEQSGFTKEERRLYILGAMKAALLIGFAFIAGISLVILLLTLIWR